MQHDRRLLMVPLSQLGQPTLYQALLHASRQKISIGLTDTDREQEKLKDLRLAKQNRAMTQVSKELKDNEIHVKTQFYSYLLQGKEPPNENELILDKKQQQIQTLIESVVEMRKGVATAAFIEDVVKLKFAVEHLQAQYKELTALKELQNSKTKRRVDKGIAHALGSLDDI